MSSGKVTVHFDGQALTGSYRKGQVILDKPNPIAVEAAATLRNHLGDVPQALSEEATPEARVRKEVREKIGALDDVLLLANPVGTAQFYDDKTNSLRVIDYGLGGTSAPGSPDYVVALRRGDGCQMLGLECKAPGKAPRGNQEDKHKIWRRAGIWVYTVQSGQEAEMAIDDARRRCGS
jgi:hypothetical protein